MRFWLLFIGVLSCLLQESLVVCRGGRGGGGGGRGGSSRGSSSRGRSYSGGGGGSYSSSGGGSGGYPTGVVITVSVIFGCGFVAIVVIFICACANRKKPNQGEVLSTPNSSTAKNDYRMVHMKSGNFTKSNAGEIRPIPFSAINDKHKTKTSRCAPEDVAIDMSIIQPVDGLLNSGNFYKDVKRVHVPSSTVDSTGLPSYSECCGTSNVTVNKQFGPSDTRRPAGKTLVHQHKFHQPKRKPDVFVL